MLKRLGQNDNQILTLTLVCQGVGVRAVVKKRKKKKKRKKNGG